MSIWKSEEEKRQTIIDFIVAGAIITVGVIALILLR
jgi:hypothetical protein